MKIAPHLKRATQGSSTQHRKAKLFHRERQAGLSSFKTKASKSSLNKTSSAFGSESGKGQMTSGGRLSILS
jgi:hypothetical protein